MKRRLVYGDSMKLRIEGGGVEGEGKGLNVQYARSLAFRARAPRVLIWEGSSPKRSASRAMLGDGEDMVDAEMEGR